MRYSHLSKYRPELMGVAMLGVLLFHAVDLEGALGFLRAAGFGGVDMFLLLSGLGLAMSLTRREQEYGSFMRRRLRRIMPAYFAVMLPYTSFLYARRRAMLSTFLWNSALLSYWLDAPGKFNWYITGIVLFYAVTPALYRFLSSGHPAVKTAAISLLAVLASQILMRDTYWNHLDIVYRVPVYTMGLLLGLWTARGREPGVRDYLVWGAGLAAAVAYAAAYRSLGEYAPTVYVFIGATVPVCLTISLLFEKLPLGLLRRCLRFLGENSLEIYLLNVSFFSETDLIRRVTGIGNTYLYYAVMLPLNVLLGWALHWGIRKASEAIGARRKNFNLPS